MQTKFTIALVLIFHSACGVFIQQAVAQVPDVPGWQIIVNDEFDGSSLDTQLWTALNRRNSFNNEKQFYHPNQVTVVDGHLNLTAINVPREGKAFQSGLITSDALYGPGRFEARMKLPTGQGMWPAFWLNANNVDWPKGGEIDILENRGSQPNLVSSAYHWQVDQQQPCCDAARFVFKELVFDGPEEENFHNDFHTYAVEWEETQLRFYVDDVLYHTINETGSRPIFETPKNIILNLAVGGNFGGDPDGTTVFPQTLLVDYVRVWQKQTAMPGDYNGDGQVDAADFTVWRNSLGQSGIGLPADGSGNGTVDAADHNIWKSHFGAGGSGATSEKSIDAVPESTALWLSIPICYIWQLSRRRSPPFCF